MINFNKKEKSLFENQAHSDTDKKQQQFPDKIYSQKARSQYRKKKGNKHSIIKYQQQMTARKANYFDRHRDKPTNSKHKQSKDKEGKFEAVTM